MVNANELVADTTTEINYSNYWEHFKAAKDMSLYLPLLHPKRLLVESEMNKILDEIQRKDK